MFRRVRNMYQKEVATMQWLTNDIQYTSNFVLTGTVFYVSFWPLILEAAVPEAFYWTNTRKLSEIL